MWSGIGVPIGITLVGTPSFSSAPWSALTPCSERKQSPIVGTSRTVLSATHPTSRVSVSAKNPLTGSPLMR